MASSTSILPPQASSLSSPSLETLVSHLLAAKRSLSAVDHVYHANDIVTATRQALESHTITAARTTFLRNGSDAQIDVLNQVQVQTRNIAQECVAEFQAVIKELDIAESRLQTTLSKLRQTIVEAGLRPAEEERRSLIDFVDESGVQGLLGTIKESIDATGDARKEYEMSDADFEEEIFGIKSLIEVGHKRVSMQHCYNSPVPEILDGMEEHAKEMADNLESLVNHFDLCVNAIKHMEGGGAAAQKIAAELPEGVGLGLDIGNTDVPLESITEEEKRDMLEVLEKDSSEVEDVVLEIKGRISDMELKIEHVSDYTDRLSDDYAKIVRGLKMLEGLGNRLPSYITQSQLFLQRWDEEKTKIEQHMEELEDLREFYDGFLRAYDNLILEVGRRKSVEVKMTEILQEAVDKLDKLYNEEVMEREVFRQEQGDFLPIDIWPGLMKPPTKFGIEANDGIIENVPDLSKSIIRGAIQRVSGRSSNK